jgi:hypothetical protein
LILTSVIRRSRYPCIGRRCQRAHGTGLTAPCRRHGGQNPHFFLAGSSSLQSSTGTASTSVQTPRRPVASGRRLRFARLELGNSGAEADGLWNCGVEAGVPGNSGGLGNSGAEADGLGNSVESAVQAETEHCRVEPTPAAGQAGPVIATGRAGRGRVGTGAPAESAVRASGGVGWGGVGRENGEWGEEGIARGEGESELVESHYQPPRPGRLRPAAAHPAGRQQPRPAAAEPETARFRLG